MSYICMHLAIRFSLKSVYPTVNRVYTWSLTNGEGLSDANSKLLSSCFLTPCFCLSKVRASLCNLSNSFALEPVGGAVESLKSSEPSSDPLSEPVFLADATLVMFLLMRCLQSRYDLPKF